MFGELLVIPRERPEINEIIVMLLYLCFVFHVAEDLSLTMGRISILALEAWLGSCSLLWALPPTPLDWLRSEGGAPATQKCV